MERICLTCGETFRVAPNVIAKGKGKYCSRQCKPKAAVVHCQTCEKEFKVSWNVIAKGSGKYCSRACRKRSNSICQTCGEEFYCPPSSIKKSKNGGRFCSRECYQRPRRERTLQERFWDEMKSVPRIDGQCWIWPGYTSHEYGTIQKIEGRINKSIGAHRVSFEIFHGSSNPDLNVLHHCDNPPCVNPEHLYQGTDKDNMRDMIVRDRINIITRKLSHSDVYAIRSLISQGISRTQIAKAYHITVGHVSAIKTGKVWSHLP